MTARPCSVPTCQRTPATACAWCKRRYCGDHELRHDCPPQQAISRAADDPVLKRRALAERAPEEVLTTQAIAALNLLPGVSAWRTKNKQGSRKSDDLDGILDISGFASPDGISIFVETKRVCKDGCVCPPCTRQRKFAERASAAGCVVVLNARTVQTALDGVRLGLARKRGEQRSTG